MPNIFMIRLPANRLTTMIARQYSEPERAIRAVWALERDDDYPGAHVIHGAMAGQQRREVHHRGRDAAVVHEPGHVRGRARQRAQSDERDDLDYPVRVEPETIAGNLEEQEQHGVTGR